MMMMMATAAAAWIVGSQVPAWRVPNTGAGHPWLKGQSAYLKVFFPITAKQRSSGTHHVRGNHHNKERRMIGEDVVKQFQPFLPGQNLREHGFKKRPGIDLEAGEEVNEQGLDLGHGNLRKAGTAKTTSMLKYVLCCFPHGELRSPSRPLSPPVAYRGHLAVRAQAFWAPSHHHKIFCNSHERK